MKKNLEFYRCKHCGNLIVFINKSIEQVTCCNEKMMSISPNTVEASVEKHLPVVRFEGNKTSVSVGSIEHPMNPEHYIEWIVLETDHGFRIEYLEPGNKPEVFFNKDEAMPIAVYAYCNLHGLWKTDMV